MSKRDVADRIVDWVERKAGEISQRSEDRSRRPGIRGPDSEADLAGNERLGKQLEFIRPARQRLMQHS